MDQVYDPSELNDYVNNNKNQNHKSSSFQTTYLL